MTYTKGTFEMVAAVIAQQVRFVKNGMPIVIPPMAIRDDDEDTVSMARLMHMADEFATQFERSNSAFDRARFLKACGLEGK